MTSDPANGVSLTLEGGGDGSSSSGAVIPEDRFGGGAGCVAGVGLLAHPDTTTQSKRSATHTRVIALDISRLIADKGLD
jgi:hypothetical protein